MRNGGVAEWQNGRIAEWQSGRMDITIHLKFIAIIVFVSHARV